MSDDLGVFVQAGTSVRGAAVTAFVAYVETVAPDGQRHVVRVVSDGTPAERADAIVADTTT